MNEISEQLAPKRGITGVTRGPRDLALHSGAPEGQQWIYQIGLPFQISPKEAAMFINIRVGKTPIVDLEAGTDLIIFDDIDQIDDSRSIVLDRVKIERHPRTGDKLWMVCGTFGGFVPLGAKREDGAPHPHAGTGFGLALVMGYPAELEEQRDTHLDMKSDIHSYLRLQQYAYDGKTFSVTESVDMPHDALLPGWSIIEHGFTAAIPSGDDLLYPLSNGAINAWDSGLSRWRRGADGRWMPVDYCLVAPGASEPTVVRDFDGSLLMGFRPWMETNPRPYSFDLFRSTDEGHNWERIMALGKFCFGAPIILNRAADGSLYVVTNRYREPIVHRHARREMIILWPLSEDRRTFLEQIGRAHV